jgi:hypothetical protein
MFAILFVISIFILSLFFKPAKIEKCNDKGYCWWDAWYRGKKLGNA